MVSDANAAEIERRRQEEAEADSAEIDRAKALAAAITEHFSLRVGHFHPGPVGPHPRGSVQLTVPPELFGEVAEWLAINRSGLTIFAHASTGELRPRFSSERRSSPCSDTRSRATTTANAATFMAR